MLKRNNIGIEVYLQQLEHGQTDESNSVLKRTICLYDSTKTVGNRVEKFGTKFLQNIYLDALKLKFNFF